MSIYSKLLVCADTCRICLKQIDLGGKHTATKPRISETELNAIQSHITCCHHYKAYFYEAIKLHKCQYN